MTYVNINAPIRRPGGAVRPAINDTTGFGFLRVRLCWIKNSAASSSAEPPISPIRMMPIGLELFCAVYQILF
jgi:hypothetical protein